jgi:hypothetical protein
MTALIPTLRKYHVPLIGALLVLIGFFLPWLNFALELGELAPNMSAFSIATLGRSDELAAFVPESRIILVLWLFLIIAVVSLGLGLWAFRNPANEGKAALGHFVGGLLGLLLLVVPLIYVWVREPEAFAAADAVADPGLGLWLTIIGLLLMLASGFLLYQNARQGAGEYQYEPYVPSTTQSSTPTPYGGSVVSAADAGLPRASEYSADVAPMTAAAMAPGPASRATEVLNKEPAALAWLVVKDGPRAGHTFRLSENTSIGRDAGNDVIIDDTSMSGQHARVKLEDGNHFMLYDLASTNGVFAYDAEKGDWERVYRYELTDGRQIKLGRTVLHFMHLDQGPTG